MVSIICSFDKILDSYLQRVQLCFKQIVECDEDPAFISKKWVMSPGLDIWQEIIVSVGSVGDHICKETNCYKLGAVNV